MRAAAAVMAGEGGGMARSAGTGTACGVPRGLVFGLFTAAYFLSYFLRSANAVIAGDLARELSLSAAQLGLMTSLFFGTFALAQLPLGPGLDRWGPRLVAPAMMLVAVGGALVFAAAQSFAALALGRALIGFGMAALLPSGFKVVSQWYPPERGATMSGLLVGIGATGALVAATPLAWANARVGWRAVFVAAALVVALSALAIVAWSRSSPPGVALPRVERGQGERGGLGAVFTDARFWRIAPLGFFHTGGLLATQSLWAGPYLFDVLGLDPLPAGNFLLLLGLGTTAGYATSGWLCDRFGVARVVAACAGLFALCQLALAARPPLALVAPLYALFGYSGGFCIMLMAHARQVFPPGMTGQAVAAVNFFGIGGTFLLQWWMGLIIGLFPAATAGRYQPGAYTAAFLFTAAGTIMTLAWYLPLALRRATRRPAAKLDTADTAREGSPT